MPPAGGGALVFDLPLTTNPPAVNEVDYLADRALIKAQELGEQRDDLLGALQRLSDQCDRMRLPHWPESDAEKFAKAVLIKVAGKPL